MDKIMPQVDTVCQQTARNRLDLIESLAKGVPRILPKHHGPLPRLLITRHNLMLMTYC